MSRIDHVDFDDSSMTGTVDFPSSSGKPPVHFSYSLTVDEEGMRSVSVVAPGLSEEEVEHVERVIETQDQGV